MGSTWLVFVLGVVVFGVVGIAIGLAIGGRLFRWSERAAGDDGGAPTAETGTPEADAGGGGDSPGADDAGDDDGTGASAGVSSDDGNDGGSDSD
jgi:hypothetical protein